ncbi:PP2C family protein-serine/threonine phosphatase [Lederbergia graminis]|uniref:PP2C family protein-serine/threonine phosphatase n=1 Tax=Lederbergia graminis TaxID=735518 RepID=A0ABW0LJS7_9BACI
MDFRDSLELKYKDMLTHYLMDPNERILYQGQKLSRKLIEFNIAPEEVVSLHKSIISDSDWSKKELIDSFDILLEVMIGYGFAYREHQSLRVQQLALKNEIEVAANMQQTLLGTSIPHIEGLDIGAISIPANQMNGDYHHFVKDENECLGVAIADVIGKGIPAALSMSMIKYALDSFPENRNKPGAILQNLNRVVEQNVDTSMFITMCYGIYNPTNHIFSYASAGHEPGFLYSHKHNAFSDLDGKGLLLGIEKKTKYKEYEKRIFPGDMIILLSDGVTECKQGDRFIEREDLVQFIEKYKHLPSQDIVTNIYKDLERLQGFKLRDDFTLIILKRIS